MAQGCRRRMMKLRPLDVPSGVRPRVICPRWMGALFCCMALTGCSNLQCDELSTSAEERTFELIESTGLSDIPRTTLKDETSWSLYLESLGYREADAADPLADLNWDDMVVFAHSWVHGGCGEQTDYAVWSEREKLRAVSAYRSERRVCDEFNARLDLLVVAREQSTDIGWCGGM